MKLDAPKNPNYAATVVRLPNLLELEGADNLLAAPLFGFQAIVDKSHAVGELGVVFPAECQLSEDFCYENNLHRHGDKNKDESAKGYLEDNRRVRAIKLRGHRSDCLFMPVESLAYTKAKIGELKEGESFDHLNGKEICRKYVIKTREPRGQQKQVKKFVRVDPRLFPEHEDTTSWFRNSYLIPEDHHVYVTQKVHGTSIRLGRVPVLRKLSLRDRFAKRLGVAVQETEYDAIAGSRKVVKDPRNPDYKNANHFYDLDIWSAFLDRVEHLLPENFIVYGELIGWVSPTEPIQTNYTYESAPGVHELFVYRVAIVNPKGLVTDLSWPQVRRFCYERDLKHVPDLWEGPHKEFVAEDWVDKRLADILPFGVGNGPPPLPLGDNKKLVDEGVCVRADGLTPTILKAKSPIFLAHETRLLDKDVLDIESAENEDVA